MTFNNIKESTESKSLKDNDIPLLINYLLKKV
jgi:hypothetical protein